MTFLPLFLMDALLKGSVLLSIAAIAAYLLRGHSAATRHAVWAIALLGQLALPVLSFGLPDWNLPVLPYQAAQMEVPRTGPSQANLVDPASAANARSALAGMPMSAPRVSPLAGLTLPSMRTAVVTVWLLGFLLLLGRLLIGLRGIGTLAARAEPVRDTRWLGLARQIAATFRVHRSIALLRGKRFDVPVTWGIVRPKVLLPVDADEWVETRRHLVLMHEMAHIKRFDSVTQLLGCLARAIFWMNPLVWLAARQMRREQERACDDYVIRGGVTASTYARELLTMVQQRHAPTTPAILALARRSEFEGRMTAILDPSRNRLPLDRIRMVLAGALALALMVPLAAFRPVPRAAPTPQPLAAPTLTTPTIVVASVPPLATPLPAAGPGRSAPDDSSLAAPLGVAPPKRGTPKRAGLKRNRQPIEKRQDSQPALAAQYIVLRRSGALSITPSATPSVYVALAKSLTSGCSARSRVQLEIIFGRETNEECAIAVNVIREDTPMAAPSHSLARASEMGDSLIPWIDSDRPRPIARQWAVDPALGMEAVRHISRTIADSATRRQIELAVQIMLFVAQTQKQFPAELDLN